jgi:hypothetical protein
MEFRLGCVNLKIYFVFYLQFRFIRFSYFYYILFVDGRKLGLNIEMHVYIEYIFINCYSNKDSVKEKA